MMSLTHYLGEAIVIGEANIFPLESLNQLILIGGFFLLTVFDICVKSEELAEGTNL
jgi:hypothetical protein